MPAMSVAHSIKGDGCMLHLVSDGVSEFVVQVVDRESPSLRRWVTNTYVWRAPARKGTLGTNPVKEKFWLAAANGDPVLRLPVASVEVACDALSERCA